MTIVKYALALVLAFFAVDAALAVLTVLKVYLELPAASHATGLVDYGSTLKVVFLNLLVFCVGGYWSLRLFGVVKKRAS